MRLHLDRSQGPGILVQEKVDICVELVRLGLEGKGKGKMCAAGLSGEEEGS